MTGSVGGAADRVVICANSYLQYKNALYLASQNYRKRQVTLLIPGKSPDLFNFLTLINEMVFQDSLVLRYFDMFSQDQRRTSARGLSKLFYLLPDIIREQRYLGRTLDKELSGISGADVYFFDRGLATIPLVNRLKGRNRLIFMPSYPPEVTPREYHPAGLAEYARLLIYKLTYGRGTALGELQYERGIPHMSDKFVAREIDRVINREEQEEMMRGFDLTPFKTHDTSRYRVIYFFDDIGHYALDEGAYRKNLAWIFELLGKHFPGAIARKYHPGYHSDGLGITTGDVLPDFIPAELLHNDNVKAYLSGYSIALLNVEKGAVISILDMVTFKDEPLKANLKDIMVRMNAGVLFPKSLDELDEMLANLARN